MELFNQSTVETFTSSEQLDKSVKIVSVSGWIILAAAFILIASGLLWGFLGSMPEKIEVNGILVNRGGIYIITSKQNGIVSDISIKKNDFIRRGDVIARLKADDITAGMSELSDLIAALESYDIDSRDNITSSDLLELYSIKVGIRELDGRIRSASDSGDKQLLAGYIKEMDKLVNDFNFKKKYKINEYTKQLEEMKNLIRDSKQIISPVSGIVKSVESSIDGLVQTGSVFATVLLEENSNNSDDLQAVFYVPIQSGKKIMPGMKVNIYPSTVNPQKHGHMNAVVTQVSKYAVGSVDMLKTLGDASLVEQFSMLGPVLEVKTELYKDPDSVNGFEWSSSEGTRVDIFDNTICSGKIIIKDKKPISNLFPFIE